LQHLLSGLFLPAQYSDFPDGTLQAVKEKENAIRFAPLWNEIIGCLREEDLISNRYYALVSDVIGHPCHENICRCVALCLFLVKFNKFLSFYWIHVLSMQIDMSFPTFFQRKIAIDDA
jgi:hypothetical protein